MNVLLESGAHRSTARSGWTFLSAAAHASLITAAILATERVAGPAAERVRAEPVIYVAPTPQRPAPTEPATTWRAPRVPTDGVVLEIPRIPMPGPVDLSRTNVERTLLGEIGGGLPAPGAPTAPSGGVYSEAVVERTVMPWARNPSPKYPSQLRASGLPGTVIVRFVVDTSGTVEQGSVIVLESTHAAFADAVRAWLPRTRYFPAEISGRHVRQLVQQRVEFQLER